MMNIVKQGQKGKESPQHHVMVEAFEIRLRNLFPNSLIKCGRKIQSIGLKPDIYIEHPDGRIWVYEMVQGNKSPSHLSKNHQKYQVGGIKDYWILWNDPFATKLEEPSNQGIMLPLFEQNQKASKSDKLVKTILKIHADHFLDSQSVIYVFNFDQSISTADAGFMKGLSVGVNIYAVNLEIDYTDKVSAYKTLLFLSEVDFSKDGKFQMYEHVQMDSALLENVLRSQGLDSSVGFSQSEFQSQINSMVTDVDKQASIQEALAGELLKGLSPNELEELGDFFNSGGIAKLHLILNDLPQIAGPISLNSGDGLINTATVIEEIANRINVAENLPPVVIKFFSAFLVSGQAASIGETLKWQESSDAFNKLNEASPDSTSVL